MALGGLVDTCDTISHKLKNLSVPDDEFNKEFKANMNKFYNTHIKKLEQDGHGEVADMLRKLSADVQNQDFNGKAHIIDFMKTILLQDHRLKASYAENKDIGDAFSECLDMNALHEMLKATPGTNFKEEADKIGELAKKANKEYANLYKAEQREKDLADFDVTEEEVVDVVAPILKKTATAAAILGSGAAGFVLPLALSGAANVAVAVGVPITVIAAPVVAAAAVAMTAAAALAISIPVIGSNPEIVEKIVGKKNFEAFGDFVDEKSEKLNKAINNFMDGLDEKVEQAAKKMAPVILDVMKEGVVIKAEAQRKFETIGKEFSKGIESLTQKLSAMKTKVQSKVEKLMQERNAPKTAKGVSK